MATIPTQPLANQNSMQAIHIRTMERMAMKTVLSAKLMIIPTMTTAMAVTITAAMLTTNTAMPQSGKRQQPPPASASATLCMLGGALFTLKGKQQHRPCLLPKPWLPGFQLVGVIVEVGCLSISSSILLGKPAGGKACQAPRDIQSI